LQTLGNEVRQCGTHNRFQPQYRKLICICLFRLYGLPRSIFRTSRGSLLRTAPAGAVGALSRARKQAHGIRIWRLSLRKLFQDAAVPGAEFMENLRGRNAWPRIGQRIFGQACQPLVQAGLFALQGKKAGANDLVRVAYEPNSTRSSTARRSSPKSPRSVFFAEAVCDLPLPFHC
jgi:hypothetical protein